MNTASFLVYYFTSYERMVPSFDEISSNWNTSQGGDLNPFFEPQFLAHKHTFVV